MWIWREVSGSLVAILLVCLICASAAVLGSIGYVARSGVSHLVGGSVKGGLLRIAYAGVGTAGVVALLRSARVEYAIWVISAGCVALGSLGVFMVPGDGD